MLYDLSWLAPGKIYPPPCEAARLADYRANERLFEGDSYRIYKKCFRDCERRLTKMLGGELLPVIHAVEINYHRLTSVSTADLVCGEVPSFCTETDKEPALGQALDSTGLLGMLHSVFIDVSRYGDAVLRLFKNPDTGKAAITQYNPGQVHKIVDPECPTRVMQTVLATVVEDPSAAHTGGQNPCKLLVQIHSKGQYIRREYTVLKCAPDTVTDPKTGRDISSGVDYWRILQQTGKDEVVQTGLSGSAVFTISQMVTSGTVWGHDDYAPLDPLLAEIWARFSHVAHILDRHAEPDAYAPQNAFLENPESGKFELATGGNTYMLGPGDSPPGYITWDGQLTAAFEEIRLLLEQLYKVSEMGAVYEACLSGAAISTETAKMHFVKPLAKVRRITNGAASTLLQLLCSAAELNGSELSPSDIRLTWYDGLPNDEMQEIQKAAAKIQADLSTPKRENMDRFGVPDTTAEEIEEDVRNYNADRNAAFAPGYRFSMTGDPNGTE